MKHTPGPWEYHPAMNYTGYSIAPLGTLPTLAACERFGESLTITCFNFPGSTEANARLIAAAPDLLESLSMIVNQYTELPAEVMEEVAPYWLPKAMAAIAKAGGE